MNSESIPATLALLSPQITDAYSGRFVEAILQSSPDVILIVDDRGTIVFVNQRCTDLLGYTADELLGQRVEMLVPPDYSDHQAVREQYQKNPVRKAMGTRMLLNVRHKSGSRLPAHIALNPLPPLSGQNRLIHVAIRDATPLFNSQQNLLLQSVAMQAAANGIIITDVYGVIQWVNPAATLITGYSTEELIGAHTRLLKSGQHDPAFYKQLWETVLAGNTWSGEIINRRKCGKLYYEEQYIAPVRDDHGEITHLIAIKQDVTTRRVAELQLQEAHQSLKTNLSEIERLANLLQETNQQLEVKVQARTAELAQANAQLQEVDTLKSSFLGVISHELRTPFTSILFALGLLENTGLDNLTADQRDMFQQLSQNVQAAHGMINNLIKYAAFVRKQGVMHLVELQMPALVNEVLRLVNGKAERKDLVVATDFAPSLPAIRGDQDRLFDAVYELVDNAVKFTPPHGTITIQCQVVEGQLRLAVRDTGPGLPPERLTNLWESFAQMADPLRRGREGLGLGLALVDYIVRAHHGQVWAESERGVGSTFGFWLPI